jgi:hypothetical protein
MQEIAVIYLKNGGNLPFWEFGKAFRSRDELNSGLRLRCESSKSPGLTLARAAC